jgi:hypothetical protein
MAFLHPFGSAPQLSNTSAKNIKRSYCRRKGNLASAETVTKNLVSKRVFPTSRDQPPPILVCIWGLCMKATCAFPLKYHKWSVMQVWDELLVCRAWLGDEPLIVIKLSVFLVFKLILYFLRKYFRKVAPFFVNGQSLVNVSEIIGNPLGNSIPRVRQCQQPSGKYVIWCHRVLATLWQFRQRV